MINSEYTNLAGFLKNCYLIFDADENQDCSYMKTVKNSKDCMDGITVYASELSYEVVNVDKCFNVYFSEDIEASHNVYFSKNLSGCGNCIGCINLRNKQYYIFNEPHSPEEYKKKLEEFQLNSFSGVERLRAQGQAFWRKHPHKYMHGRHNTNASGDYVSNSKNVLDCYMVDGGENLKFSQFITIKPAKDAYDYTEWGHGAEQVYECVTVGQGVSNVRMSMDVWQGNSLDIEYSLYTLSSSHMFGCIGMRKKEYCILNTQYPKEEYEKLRARIIQDMSERPYVDAKGRKFTYGEFFPYDLSLFDYNESTAQDYFPLSQEATLAHGWRWKEKEDTRYQITKRAEELPDNIKDADDSITKEIIECASCKRAYRIIPQELELLRRFGLPIPRKCFECRHHARLARMNPMRFYDRTCAKCGAAIRTSYAPERPEIIYCESCYNNEVI